jgi:hypothetical protein
VTTSRRSADSLIKETCEKIIMLEKRLYDCGHTRLQVEGLMTGPEEKHGVPVVNTRLPLHSNRNQSSFESSRSR